jgi:hypothetical protein
LSDELPGNLRPIADFFGLPGVAQVEKDFHVVRVIWTLVRDIAVDDASEFGNQYPEYEADITGETRKALAALRADPLYRGRYEDFVAAMVYGERPEFSDALATVSERAEAAFKN